MTPEQTDIKSAELKCTAPRITRGDIEDAIASVEYVKYVTKTGQVLRWAIINTRSGFSVTGDPSCAVSPENDREEMGKEVAYRNAEDKLWAHLAFALKEKLHDASMQAGKPE